MSDLTQTGGRSPDVTKKSGLPSISPDIIEQEHGAEFDDLVPAHGYHTLPVIGLGGSAGSIQALQRFFAAMPADSGMAFVVVIHLSSEHASIMDEILQRSTPMRVIQVSAEE